MAAGQKKPEVQWTADERKAANLDQRLKSLIMSVLPDDQMNSDFQDSLDDEEDTRSSHEYLNDLEEEYQAKSLLAKSKRFFKKDTQRFNSAKATDQTKCHKYGKKGHFARDCWSKTLAPSYQSPFQPKILLSSENKPEIRNTIDFEAKYNKVKAKLALLSSSALAPSSFSRKNKGLIVESHDWYEEEVSSYDEETEIKALMVLTNKERIYVGKESTRNGEWTKITIKSNLHKSSEAEDSTLPNHDTDEVPSNKSQGNTTDPSPVVSDCPAPDYDSTNESLVSCNTPKICVAAEYCPGALLHNTTAQATRERPLKVSFVK
nr:hypothetical protein [Tanacetum cinerariifolium]